jgi:tRNA(Glu) U13 pseudouridine synthase TruD
MKLIVRLLLATFLLTLPFTFGCSRFAIAKRQEEKRRKELARMNKEKALESQLAYEEAVQRHYDMQDKKTRKEMRRNMKKSLAWKENKKPFFLVRWFTPKSKRVTPRPGGYLIRQYYYPSIILSKRLQASAFKPPAGG